jgi:FkbM family methyltransferase
MKRILIAVPVNRYIEPETFKSIYDQHIPAGYEVDFQIFQGQEIEHSRNNIADWLMNKGYDYLFAVDSDIAFAPNTLEKLLSHDRDMVSGIYIQRIPNTHTLEITRKNKQGGLDHVLWETIAGQGLVSVDGCGFGCLLIKSDVFKAIPRPQFVYKSALDHAHTFSEDFYFCQQALRAGFKIWADTDVVCEHIGSYTYRVKPAQEAIQTRLRQLASMNLLCAEHKNYLIHMRDELKIKPRIIYDIGASVLHWTVPASHVWPEALYYAVEAMEQAAFLYQEVGVSYAIELLSDRDNQEKEFYQNVYHPGGNSYYRENVNHSPNAQVLFSDHHRVKKQTVTLDTLVERNNWPLPDLIKIDVQGAELDILKGAVRTLKHCQNLIVELQVVEYNTGAPCAADVIEWLISQGFTLKAANFVNDPVTGDYHFTKS